MSDQVSCFTLNAVAATVVAAVAAYAAGSFVHHITHKEEPESSIDPDSAQLASTAQRKQPYLEAAY